MGNRWFVGGSLILATGLFAIAWVTPRQATTVARAGGGRAAVGEVAARTSTEAHLGATPSQQRPPRPRPPRFVSAFERALVEAPIVTPTAPPGYEGLALTPQEQEQVSVMRKIMIEEIIAARGFMTNGNEDREKFRAAVRAARDEYRANLVATLGKDKAEKLRALVMARGESSGLRELGSALRQ